MTDTIELNAYREQVRDWVSDNLERAERTGPELRGQSHLTRESVKPERELQARIYDAGYAGISLPTEYGGQGLTADHERVWHEESAGYRLPNFRTASGAVVLQVMLAHASPEFLARHVPPMLRGDHLWVQFFSEPGTGSDLAGVKTRADRDGDTWVLNGSKIWSSGAHYADYGMCLARTNWDAPKHQGLTWFAVACDTEGVAVHPIKEINGDYEFCQEFFTDVVLTDDDIIGELDNGWPIARTMLVFERGGVVGIGGREARTRAGSRHPQFPRELAEMARATGTGGDAAARQKVAQVHVLNYVQAQLGRQVARMIERGVPPAAAAAYGKYTSGIWDVERARIALELSRGTALTWEEGDSQAQAAAVNYLNSKIMAIAGGTNQMQLNSIGEQALGLPREPSFDSVKPYREVVRDAKNWSGKVS